MGWDNGDRWDGIMVTDLDCIKLLILCNLCSNQSALYDYEINQFFD